MKYKKLSRVYVNMYRQTLIRSKLNFVIGCIWVCDTILTRYFPNLYIQEVYQTTVCKYNKSDVVRFRLGLPHSEKKGGTTAEKNEGPSED